MGNKLSQTYNMEKTPIFTTRGGWRVFQGSAKEKPEHLSVFVTSENADYLREEARNLQKFRHPCILSVVEALMEDKTTMAFATKRVVGTLASTLASGVLLASVEVKAGVVDILEALAFLQENGLAHGNITPDAIFISASGKWLLGGFAHIYGNWNSLQDTRYIDPLCRTSDVFSLGLLWAEALTGTVVFPGGVPTRREELQRILALALQSGRPGGPFVASLVQRLVMDEQGMRAREVLQHAVLRDPHVQALKYLETMGDRSETERCEFLRGFKGLLELPSELTDQRVVDQRIQLSLARNLSILGGSSTWQITLEILFPLISSSEHFQGQVWPHLRSLFRAAEIKLECVLVLVSNLEICGKYASVSEVNDYICPFVARCLEFQEERLLTAVLRSLPGLAKTIDMKLLSTNIAPKVVDIVIKNPVVRRYALKASAEIIDYIDKKNLEILYGNLENIQNIDVIIVAKEYLETLEVFSKKFPLSFRAKRLLLRVTSLLCEEGLTAEAFEHALVLVKTIVGEIEGERRKDYANRQTTTNQVRGMLEGVGAGAGGGGGAAARKTEAVLDLEGLFMAPPLNSAVQKSQAPQFEGMMNGYGASIRREVFGSGSHNFGKSSGANEDIFMLVPTSQSPAGFGRGATMSNALGKYDENKRTSESLSDPFADLLSDFK